MALTSPAYFAFLGLLFVAYWPATRLRYAALSLILFANLFFYCKWDLTYLVLIPAAATVDFLVGFQLGRPGSAGSRRALVTVSILVNVGLMATAKYFALLNPAWTWTLPLGLSFYAFQSLTYTIDVYRKDARPATSYLAYLSAVTFFPTILAGPINRIPALLKQFEKLPRTLGSDENGRALFLIGMGLMKKFLVADYLSAQLINRVFDSPKLYSGFEVLVAVYAYSLELYYDFSGYTDIATGSALLLGIRIPANFNRPYAAENLADFWRRWHITLSNWLRDYLYFSLPGLRSRWKIFSYLNLVITMALGGLWHGASVNFLIWGLLHGLGLAGLRLYQSVRKNPKPSPSFAPRFVRGMLTFHFVTFAWIFFRAGSLQAAGEIIGQIGSFTFSAANLTGPFALILVLAAAAHWIPKAWYQGSLQMFSNSPAYVQAAALALLVLSIQYVANTGAAPFIYTRF